MKYIIVLVIKMYWFLVPTHKRNKCFFKESCSAIVYKTAIEKGFWEAIKIFRERVNACTPNYEILVGENFEGVVTKNRIEIPFNELSISMQKSVDNYKIMLKIK